MARLANADPASSNGWLWGVGAGLTVVAALWAISIGQFAAPPAYVLGTPDQETEAGVCLFIAQEALSREPLTLRGGITYPEEARRFWAERLRKSQTPIGPVLATSRQYLSTAVTALEREQAGDWLPRALQACSRRALNYGGHFNAFGPRQGDPNHL